MSDLVALLVVVPIVGSVLALIAAAVRPRTGWPVAVATMGVEAALAARIAFGAVGDGPIRTALAGFPAPIGIELVVDGLSASMVVLIVAVALGVLGYARVAGPRSNRFFSVVLLLVAGLMGMAVTADLFNMYVFLEITGLTAYALVASGRDGRSAQAALLYLVVGTFGASLFLLGIGFVFVATGTLNMADLAVQLAEIGYDAGLVRTGFALIAVGLFVKVAVFPVHLWQPAAYAGAPDSVSGLIAALVSTVAAYALVRVVFEVFTTAFLAAVPVARWLLYAGAIASIVGGSVLAVSQTDLKRLLAYSSVSQFGLIVGAIAVANVTAVTGAAIHLVGHAIIKGGLFLAVGVLARRADVHEVGDLAGLSERVPVGTAAFGVLALALVGVPPTVGFAGKFYVALGAIEAGAWPFAVVVLVSTLLTLAYVAGLLERCYVREAAETTAGGRVSPGMVAVVVCAAVLAVALGLLAVEYAQVIEPTIVSLLEP